MSTAWKEESASPNPQQHLEAGQGGGQSLQSSRTLGCLTAELAEAGPLTSLLPGVADTGASFPVLQQKEPFKKRWFALDPQERRLLYYKNPLVSVTAGPS